MADNNVADWLASNAGHKWIERSFNRLGSNNEGFFQLKLPDYEEAYALARWPRPFPWDRLE